MFFLNLRQKFVFLIFFPKKVGYYYSVLVNQILHTFDYRPLLARGMKHVNMGRIRSGTDTGFQLFSNVIPSTTVSSSVIRSCSKAFTVSEV